MPAEKHYQAPPGWTERSPNPFTPDGAYGPDWSCYRIREEDDDRGWNGCGTDGQHLFVVGRRWRNLAESVADFIRYECRHGRKPIVGMPADLDLPAFVGQALAETPDGPVVRPGDPRCMVHTTSREAWERILACGELRSLARLQCEGHAITGTGFEYFNEPKDYAEHIILGVVDVVYPEFVVLSRQLGRVLTDENHPYTPGARLYFDAHRIIRDGLAVRDGLHNLKVYDHLPLAPYLLLAIEPGLLDPNAMVDTWTPKTFFEASHRYFTSWLARM